MRASAPFAFRISGTSLVVGMVLAVLMGVAGGVLPAFRAARMPITVTQALTRDGFDLRQHRFSWLTTGNLGWIHQSNMLLVGVLTVLLAVGMRQMMRTGRGAVWGPRLFGLAYIIGGMLRADAVAGFPPGTTPEMVHTTWQGAVQNASRGASSLLLIASAPRPASAECSRTRAQRGTASRCVLP